MKKMKLSAAVFFAAVMLGQSTFAAVEAGSRFKKVIWLVFENEDFKPVIQQPDFAQVAKSGALFTQLKAVTHPSQPNYINMIAGSTLGVKSDRNVDLDQSHVGDLLEKVGMKWRVYAEGYPGNCFTGAKKGKYARKHVPFLSFTNVTQNPARCANIENTDRFFQDYANGSLPEFTMYIPDLNSDGHDTGVDYAGKWITSKFGNIFSNPTAIKDTLFIVTFDEGTNFSNNLIYTVLLGSNVIAGSQNSQSIGHPALLKMIEDEFKIGNLGRDDVAAPTITGIWK